MGSYLQQYGVAETRRAGVVKKVITAVVVILVVTVAAYLFFHNYAEKQVANHFLEDLNKHDYQAAYRDWGCTDQHPCPNYDFNRFQQDWGPASKAASPWKVASVDACKTFVTVNVEAKGADLQSLAVQREDRSLGFAPSPECQERQWRWGQFFHRMFGGKSS